MSHPIKKKLRIFSDKMLDSFKILTTLIAIMDKINFFPAYLILHIQK